MAAGMTSQLPWPPTPGAGLWLRPLPAVLVLLRGLHVLVDGSLTLQVPRPQTWSSILDSLSHAAFNPSVSVFNVQPDWDSFPTSSQPPF